MGTLVPKDPVCSGCKPVQQPPRPKEIDVGKSREEEESFNATSKTDEIQQEVSAVLNGPDLYQAVNGVNPAEAELRFFSNRSDIFHRIEGFFSLFRFGDVGIE